MSECIACKRELVDGVRKCPRCGSAQDLDLCVVCCKSKPKNATYCNECKSFQGWFRRVFLPVIPAVFALLFAVSTTAILPALSWWRERNSHTFVKVTGADPTHVIVKAWNTGRRPSTLIAYRLTADPVPDRAFFLDLSPEDKINANNVIESGTPKLIRLTIPGYLQPQMTNDDRVRMASALTLTLQVDIKESDDLEDAASKLHHYSDRFNTNLIETFLVQVKP